MLGRPLRRGRGRGRGQGGPADVGHIPQQRREELRAKVQQFADNTSETKIDMQSSITVLERIYLHAVASEFGFTTQSFGEGSDRYLTMSKPSGGIFGQGVNQIPQHRQDELWAKVQKFADNKKETEIKMEASITGLERKYLHGVAAEFGFTTQSLGQGRDRHLTMSKPSVDPFDWLRASVHQDGTDKGKANIEWRIDPLDGISLTYSRLCKKYSKDYSRNEIEKYWKKQCTPVPKTQMKLSLWRRLANMPTIGCIVDIFPLEYSPSTRIHGRVEEIFVDGSALVEFIAEWDKNHYGKVRVKRGYRGAWQMCKTDLELRVDPEDGNMYTFDEILKYHRGEGYNKASTKAYWDSECCPAKEAFEKAKRKAKKVRDPITVTARNIGGDIIFGPELVDGIMRIIDLKDRIAKDRQGGKNLMLGVNQLSDGTFLEDLPNPLELSVAFESKPEKVHKRFKGLGSFKDMSEAELDGLRSYCETLSCLEMDSEEIEDTEDFWRQIDYEGLYMDSVEFEGVRYEYWWSFPGDNQTGIFSRVEGGKREIIGAGGDDGRELGVGGVDYVELPRPVRHLMGPWFDESDWSGDDESEEDEEDEDEEEEDDEDEGGGKGKDKGGKGGGKQQNGKGGKHKGKT